MSNDRSLVIQRLEKTTRSEGRWYNIQVQPEFWGWCVVCQWGNIGERISSMKRIYHATEKDAYLKAEELIQRRIKKGFELVQVR